MIKEMDLKQIPERYHFLFNYNQLIQIDTLTSEKRNNDFDKLAFTRCQRCGYDLTDLASYQKYQGTVSRYPADGFAHYFHRHRLVLCDKCLRELNNSL